MDKIKHNGWANYDTWKVVVWLENEESNYRKWWPRRKEIVKMPKAKLITFLRNNMKFGDPINWANVSVTDLKKNVFSGN